MCNGTAADLDGLRRQIDEIDRQLTALFEQRMHTALGVAQYKREHGLPVLNAGRERQVLDRCTALLEDKTLEGPLRQWMEQTIASSRAAQEQYLKEQN